MCNSKQNLFFCSSPQLVTLCNSKRVYDVIDCDAMSDDDDESEQKA